MPSITVARHLSSAASKAFKRIRTISRSVCSFDRTAPLQAKHVASSVIINRKRRNPNWNRFMVSRPCERAAVVIPAILSARQIAGLHQPEHVADRETHHGNIFLHKGSTILATIPENRTASISTPVAMTVALMCEGNHKTASAGGPTANRISSVRRR